MRYYESLYIVNPNFEQSRLDKAMKTVSEKISEYGFKAVSYTHLTLPTNREV
mgnify:CR=1 FL=1